MIKYNKSINKSEILAYSSNEKGMEMITYMIETDAATAKQLLVYNSHKRNGKSKRSVKGIVQIEEVSITPFIPVSFWKDQDKGMQPTELMHPLMQPIVAEMWMAQFQSTIDTCRKLASLKVARHHIGHLLMPFQNTKYMITMPKYGADNFFAQRCNKSSGAQYEIMELAEMMKKQRDEATPVKLSKGEWHIPFKTANMNFKDNLYKSVACTAFLSFDTQDKQRDMSKYKAMFDRLWKSGHWSCFEHIYKNEDSSSFYEAAQGFSSLRTLFKNGGFEYGV